MTDKHCGKCNGKRYIYKQKFVGTQILLCPKLCSCNVYSHSEIDMFNMGENRKVLLRFPIEKTKASTGQEKEDRKILNFKRE